MASFGNTKLLDKPPLFSSGHRVGGSEINKPLNFNGLPRVSGAFVSPPPTHDVKVFKVDNDAEDDLPSFKRPKITDDNQQLQMQAWQSKDGFLAPLSFNDRPPARVEYNSSHVYVQDEGKTSATRTEGTVLENPFNPLTEPSPLGLNLRKSTSLLNLIQRKLAQNEDDGSDGMGHDGELENSVSASDKDKLKAANFPASKLRIGTWECTSRYDGDLVAKCYYAKRKLVWEVLDSGLKSKMEVQWSDISALKALFPDDHPAVLDIELSRPPLFFREINPQPRKHTLWQSTSDFTDGQATICRHHSVQFPAGVLNRHFEKLLQCDIRLKTLNERPCSITDSCFFDSRSMQLDQQHMLHYQSVLGEHSALQSFTMSMRKEEALVQPADLNALDCSKTHVAVQGPFQHGSPHQNAIEKKPIISPQCTGSDASTLAGVCHRQGGYQLQFSTVASPSSVIDHRGLTESTSSSETEEAASKDYGSKSEMCREHAHLHAPQVRCQLISSVRTGLADWAPYHLQERAMTRALESAASPLHNYSSEQHALNALSLHLLGEPISSRDLHHYSPGGSLHGRDAQEIFGVSGPSQLQAFSHRDPTHKLEVSSGNLHHHGYVSFGESNLYTKVTECNQQKPVQDQHCLKTVPSSLTSHGSHVDLVYLPRVISQPQFLEPGL